MVELDADDSESDEVQEGIAGIAIDTSGVQRPLSKDDIVYRDEYGAAVFSTQHRRTVLEDPQYKTMPHQGGHSHKSVREEAA